MFRNRGDWAKSQILGLRARPANRCCPTGSAFRARFDDHPPSGLIAGDWLCASEISLAPPRTCSAEGGIWFFICRGVTAINPTRDGGRISSRQTIFSTGGPTGRRRAGERVACRDLLQSRCWGSRNVGRSFGFGPMRSSSDLRQSKADRLLMDDSRVGMTAKPAPDPTFRRAEPLTTGQRSVMRNAL